MKGTAPGSPGRRTEYDMQLDHSEKNYFASANSGVGFYSLFGEIFDPLCRLYVIKGGPGTGKSRLMRDVAAEVQSRGYDVEKYYCSSDPDSLDGVVIPALSCGLVDGTAPHTRDPEYPGAVDEIINLGDFWDTGTLRERSAEIKELAGRKSSDYRAAYAMLAAAHDCARVLYELCDSCVDARKLDSAVERATRKWKRGDSGRISYRFLDAFSMKGYARFNSFAKTAKKRIVVAGKRGAAPVFLERIAGKARELGQSVVIAPDPVDPSRPLEILLPGLETAFVRDPGDLPVEKTVNTDRFVDADAFRENRKTVSLLAKRKRELVSGAGIMLGEAAKSHFRLEEIYSGAMDYLAKEEFCDGLVDRIFGQN